MSTERKQPEWLDKAVFYEIYPQSFRDTNADGIGDFNGIIEKLDYIKELGCTALWLNPCFLSPFGDAGYDVEDYYTVAPRYGTNEDLVHLFEEAHKRQMHVLLDLVPGHTAVTCKYGNHPRHLRSRRFLCGKLLLPSACLKLRLLPAGSFEKVAAAHGCRRSHGYPRRIKEYHALLAFLRL